MESIKSEYLIIGGSRSSFWESCHHLQTPKRIIFCHWPWLYFPYLFMISFLSLLPKPKNTLLSFRLFCDCTLLCLKHIWVIWVYYRYGFMKGTTDSYYSVYYLSWQWLQYRYLQRRAKIYGSFLIQLTCLNIKYSIPIEMGVKVGKVFIHCWAMEDM